MANIEVPQPGVQSQEGALIGDENIPAPAAASVQVLDTTVPAQVVAEAGPPVDVVLVHETAVRVDEVITDPSSPLAVQVPDAGRGSLSLPIHALGNPRPEDIFAAAGKKDTPVSITQDPA